MAFELPHGPAEPDPERSWLENPLLPQGLGLAGMAALFVGVLGWLAGRSGWLAVVAAPVLLVGAFLSAWAAAIHLTGGEKFDDHPWV